MVPYQQSLTLLTDLYQLTMAYAYFKAKFDQKKAVFHLSFRKNPFHGGFAIASGLEGVVRFLEQFRFTSSDLDYLSTLRSKEKEPLFSEDFFKYLENLQLTCDIDAIPEGTVVFPHEPLIRVKGPLIQAQILESALLNLVNFSTLVTTKAARICLAAEGDPVFEFGLRRAQGIDGSLTASRAAFIGGCVATSNVLAGKLYGIPVRGTHAHSFVMAFDEEIDSFRTFAKYLPDQTILLVDTYNTLEGVKKAIRVGLEMKALGKQLVGIRLDSGDLTYLSLESRKLLDLAGLNQVMIVASNELDETIITELKRQGAKIGVWGVGTNLVTSRSQPALDGVYKLSALFDPKVGWQPKIKLSEQMQKISTPGILQVRRFESHGEYVADAIFNLLQEPPKQWKLIDPFDPTRKKYINQSLQFKDLLVPIFREGKLVYSLPSLQKIQENTKKELTQFHYGIKRFLNPHSFVVGMEEGLYDLKVHLIEKIRSAPLKKEGQALLLVDLQNDFFPGGALGVKDADQILTPLSNVVLNCSFDKVVATQDWHPKEHQSFAKNQGKNVGDVIDLGGVEQVLWPVHCVQKTFGASLAKGWDHHIVDHVVYKGTDPEIDSYSAFFDNGRKKSTGLEDFLKKQGIKRIYVLGLATDYCVKYSVLDALLLGFEVYVIVDGCRAVNLREGDGEKALQEMQKAGAVLTFSQALCGKKKP